MVSEVVNDPMHDIDLGAAKRYINLLYAPKSVLSSRTKKELNSAMENLQLFIPTEFTRKARTLNELSYWKASEHRDFVLYWGMAVLGDILEPHLFKNFLNFAIAIRIFACEQFRPQWALAQKIMSDFLDGFVEIFKAHNVVMCIHKLTHVHDECERHGPLYSFSAYRYERYIGSILRHALYSKNKVLSQIFRRVVEERNALELVEKPHLKFNSFKIFNQTDGSIRKIYSGGIVYALRDCDSFFKTKIGNLVKIEKIFHKNGEYFVICKELSKLTNLFDLPIQSSKIGIFKWMNNSFGDATITVNLSDLDYKLVVVPTNVNTTYFAIFPMLRLMK